MLFPLQSAYVCMVLISVLMLFLFSGAPISWTSESLLNPPITFSLLPQKSFHPGKCLMEISFLLERGNVFTKSREAFSEQKLNSLMISDSVCSSLTWWAKLHPAGTSRTPNQTATRLRCGNSHETATRPLPLNKRAQPELWLAGMGGWAVTSLTDQDVGVWVWIRGLMCFQAGKQDDLSSPHVCRTKTAAESPTITTRHNQNQT